jgi:aspartate/methionine/tyrosine aminotransferase
MRQKLLMDGAGELAYEIRGIVNKARALHDLGREILWENIGDPMQKNGRIPPWMKEVLAELMADDRSFGYCHSMGTPATREFLAARTNSLGGAQITGEDILFFNGLGDAISTLYNLLEPTSRVIGPSPAYSTHSSAEAAHARSRPLTYRLDPDNDWHPDLDDLYNKVKYNPNIVALLIINPDNPTGMVYPRDALDRMLDIAREFELFVVSDEIYSNITYGEARSYPLCEIVGDLPGIAMKGISKDFPWPGSRCGWLEFYNRANSAQFSGFCAALCNAKMIEVCATTLPQLAIPRIYGHPEYPAYRRRLNTEIGERSRFIIDTLGAIPELIVNEAQGAFYHTIVFREGTLEADQHLEIEDPAVRSLVESWVEGVNLDYRFVYYLLGATGICVVPASSFCSPLHGFRITALEEDRDLMQSTTRRLARAIREYLASGPSRAATRQ